MMPSIQLVQTAEISQQMQVMVDYTIFGFSWHPHSLTFALTTDAKGCNWCTCTNHSVCSKRTELCMGNAVFDFRLRNFGSNRRLICSFEIGSPDGLTFRLECYVLLEMHRDT